MSQRAGNAKKRKSRQKRKTWRAQRKEESSEGREFVIKKKGGHIYDGDAWKNLTEP